MHKLTGRKRNRNRNGWNRWNDEEDSDLWKEEEEKDMESKWIVLDDANEEEVSADDGVQQIGIWSDNNHNADIHSSSSAELSTTSRYNVRVKEAIDCLRAAVETSVVTEELDPFTLLKRERELSGKKFGEFRFELRAAVQRVEEGLVERDEESRLVVLGLVAREHVLLLGPPGTAKSVLGRRLSRLCGGGDDDDNEDSLFFQRLLTRFTTPEEIFGPLSLRALENDEYRRITTGFLPKASVAFLDEIFKANSAILNTLLTILNERQFDNGSGGVREECPIRCVVAASNELPESDELDALYDRFLLRKEVKPVSDEGLVKMLSMPHPGFSPCDDDAANTDSDSLGGEEAGGGGGTAPAKTAACDVVFPEGLDEVINSLSSAAEKHVQIGQDAVLLLQDLRTYLREEHDLELTDRRLVRAARLLKICAASDGRSNVDPLDCLLLQHIAWRFPEQKGPIREWLLESLTPGGGGGGGRGGFWGTQSRLLLNGLHKEAIVAVRKTAGDVTGKSGGHSKDVIIVQSLRKEISQLATVLHRQLSTLRRQIELVRQAVDHPWLSYDEANGAMQTLLPKAQVTAQQVREVWFDALSLELALSSSEHSHHPGSPPNDLRLKVIESLWEGRQDDDGGEVSFSDEELSMSMREAKSCYDGETFRMWKRARKRKAK